MLELKEPERRKQAKAADAEFETVARGSPDASSLRWHAAALAWVGTATARKLASDFWRVGFAQQKVRTLEDEIYAIMAARGASFFETFARLALRDAWGVWPIVRRAVREGLIAPPEGDDYIRGLVRGVSWGSGPRNDLSAVYDGLRVDPTLLDREVWELFEVDLASELSWATTIEHADSNEIWNWTRGDNLWLYALVRLADEGRLDRERLLDASLDALMRDFRASSVGWYANLHEELEPTRDERCARIDRYLALVTSPAPAVIKEGLTALRAVEDAVPPEAFARVAPTPLTQRQKQIPVDVISFLGRLCKRHPEARSLLIEAATHALGHERADVQERALKLLEQYSDDRPSAALLAYVEAVSPPLRPRVDALTGIAVAPEVVEPIEILPPRQPKPSFERARSEREALESVDSVDELIELAAMLLEGQGGGDDCERFLDGVSRLCDDRPRGFERRVAGLVKRAEAPISYGVGGTTLIAHVVKAWAAGRRETFPTSRSMLGFLALRANEVAHRAARGSPRPLLAFPTHRGGWIDPETLAARQHKTGRLFNRAQPIDLLQARVRAGESIGRLDYVASATTQTELWGRASRSLGLACSAVPTELGELGQAVASPGEYDKAPWYAATGWAGFDPLGVRWALTVLPASPEVAFAGAAVAAVDAREGASYHHPDCVLEHALEPDVPLGPEAWLAVGASLVAKSPDVPRAAVDLLVASVEDGRFDADALGSATAWLVDNDLAKVNRLEPALRDIARVSPLHAVQALRSVEFLLAHLSTTPRGLHGVLEVAVESATTTRCTIDDARARDTLMRLKEGVSASSKLAKLSVALLPPT